MPPLSPPPPPPPPDCNGRGRRNRRQTRRPFTLPLRTAKASSFRFQFQLAFVLCLFTTSSALLLGPAKTSGSKTLKSGDDNRVLSRHRRFLFPSSTGWVISATFVLSVPIDSDVTGTMLLTFPFTYTVDTGVVSGGRRMGRLPRSVGLPSSPPLSPILRREEQRLSLVSGLEDWLHELHGMGRFGREDLDVHTCALRVVCEVAMVPNSEGLIGELLHLLLTPKDVLLKLPPAYRSNEYIQAQVDGGVHGDCANYQRRCPVSFFQMLDGYNVGQLQEEFLKMYDSRRSSSSNSNNSENNSRE